MARTERIAPSSTVTIGRVTVGNKTANSILVRVDEEMGAVTVTDCCLEEQGK